MRSTAAVAGGWRWFMKSREESCKGRRSPPDQISTTSHPNYRLRKDIERAQVCSTVVAALSDYLDC